MVLQARGCPLKGIAVTSDLAAHIRRFTGNGWQRADAKDMSTIYRLHLDPAEKKRYSLLQQHECEVLRNVSSAVCSHDNACC